jgi:hypothetical protein
LEEEEEERTTTTATGRCGDGRRRGGRGFYSWGGWGFGREHIRAGRWAPPPSSHLSRSSLLVSPSCGSRRKEIFSLIWRNSLYYINLLIIVFYFDSIFFMVGGMH